MYEKHFEAKMKNIIFVEKEGFDLKLTVTKLENSWTKKDDVSI